MSKRLAVGLMSGTSVDAVDAALVSIEGAGTDTVVELVQYSTTPFSQPVKKKIFAVMSPDHSSTPLLSSLHFELGDVYADAVEKVCTEAGISVDDLSFIGSHGQTVYHQPFHTEDSVASTLQIGEPSVIAYRTHTQVVSNFRSMDMAAGGEGAPLVPYTEFLLYRKKDGGRLLQNIGGIGNVTVLQKDCSLEEVFAFDTGPGNMVIDGLCGKLFGLSYDEDGSIAARGTVHPEAARKWMEWEKDFFQKAPPKSTGRELFGEVFVNRILQEYTNIPKEDLIATATYFTALSISDAYKTFVFPRHPINEVIIGGGGSYNGTLLQMMKELLPEVTILIQEDIGYSSDAKEAIAFALLANETLHGKPGNVPGATGAKKPVILGSITPSPIITT
ncbi:anhydro-N-acetylmuramic acid kinase AnmK [Rossellomorea vietnamensis]|uniref:anhydro-N-acetylmuramic acid kinase AnmK n=1 Tax=Rossellomorea vietnamensis TaxID=218284 RepID=UPI001E639FAA|nr:anhydro-N-acetylmuramic acid kinase AnmK [Rossellomorea vietnamensis]MCC5801049.1 anhydro-N-acetylmuramic acid kinase [Rossellomorea vietnamensis]